MKAHFLMKIFQLIKKSFVERDFGKSNIMYAGTWMNISSAGI